MNKLNIYEIISIISIIISVVALIITILQHRQTRKDSFQIVSDSLFNQKNEFLSMYYEISKMRKGKTKDYLMKEIATTYCNSFESACGLYNNNALDKKIFKEVFKDEISTIYNHKGIAYYVEFDSEEYKDIYNNIKLAYKNMIE